MVGDFIEFYFECRDELPRWKAEQSYWKEIFCSVIPLLWHRFRRLRRFNAVTGLIEFVRRITS